jgi:DNA-binding GntR family transcriptional regulator
MTSAEGLGKQPLGEAIARNLREQILAGRLSPGSRLSQLSIAEQYGVSRIPVREALSALSSEGLVIMEPARGARVAALDAADVRDVYLLRERLEPMVVAAAIDRITDRHVTEAEVLVTSMDAAETSGTEWLRLDRQFHTMWNGLVDMPRLIRMVEQLWDVAQRYRALSLVSPGMASNSNIEHWMLLEAIKRRSAQDASALLEVHIRRTRVTIEGLTAHRWQPRFQSTAGDRPASDSPAEERR